jgi:hypothetical protein
VKTRHNLTRFELFVWVSGGAASWGYLKIGEEYSIFQVYCSLNFLWANWTILSLYFGRKTLVAEAIAKAKQDSFPNNEHTQSNMS